MATDIDPRVVRQLAEMHAVYRMFDADGNLLYIGVTGRSQRFGEHSDKRWFVLVAKISLEWLPSLEEAREAERNAIATERPFYNIAGKVPPDQLVPRVHVPRRKPKRYALRRSDSLTEGERGALIEMLADGTTLSKAAVALGVTKWLARVWLEGLRDEGLAVVIGRNRGAQWLRADSVRPGDGDDGT